MCGVHGMLITNSQTKPWLGQENQYGPTSPVRLRIALHANVVGHKRKQIKDLYLLFDIPQAIKQMGRDLFAELQELQDQHRHSSIADPLLQQGTPSKAHSISVSEKSVQRSMSWTIGAIILVSFIIVFGLVLIRSNMVQIKDQTTTTDALMG